MKTHYHSKWSHHGLVLRVVQGQLYLNYTNRHVLRLTWTSKSSVNSWRFFNFWSKLFSVNGESCTVNCIITMPWKFVAKLWTQMVSRCTIFRANFPCYGSRWYLQQFYIHLRVQERREFQRGLLNKFYEKTGRQVKKNPPNWKADFMVENILIRNLMFIGTYIIWIVEYR